MTKTLALSNRGFDLNLLDDRQFEELTFSLYKEKVKNEDIKFEDVHLMPGVGENGRDCILTINSIIHGVIQCKKLKVNVSDKVLVEELIKLCLHIRISNDIYNSQIDYIIASSTGLTTKAIELLSQISSEYIIKNFDFDLIIEQTINKYSKLNTVVDIKLKNEIKSIIDRFKFYAYIPTDFNNDLNKYKHLIDTYFDVKKVIDVNSFNMVKNELLQKLDPDSKTKENIESFLKMYKVNAAEKLNVVNFIGFDIHRHRQKPKEVELNDLFVAPLFSKKIKTDNKDQEYYIESDLKLSRALEGSKNLIILGDPGAGKSLLVKFIIHQLLSRNQDTIGNRKLLDYTPFRIELRKYNERRETTSITKYLTEILSSEYNCNINESELNHFFNENKFILFFDGLDEIFNLSHKIKVKELIEMFSISYKNSKCIVTSRFIGYHNINFKEKHFEEYSIQPFDNEQIEELVTKFYSSQYTNSEKRSKYIGECNKQLNKDVDTELKSNPLILTLILILTSNNIIIPDSKLEIYEACTKTLVDSIDTYEKELKIDLPIKSKRAIFSHLAYWQYELSSNNKIVTYDKALKCISDFLIERKEADDYSESQDKGAKFLTYAENRSIYFDNNFTHKTFLEYYTADYLYINFITKANGNAKRKLISIIKKYLHNPFWYIVFELLFNRIDKEQIDNELLDEIIEKQLNTDSIDVYYFLISNVSNIDNLSNSIKKIIIRKSIDFCLNGEKIKNDINDFFHEEKSLLGKLASILVYDNEYKLFVNVLNEMEMEYESNNKKFSELYCFLIELKSLIEIFGFNINLDFINDEIVKRLSCEDIFIFCSGKVFRNRNNYPEILKEQIKFFGTESIVKSIKYKIRENVVRLSTFDIIMIDCIDNQNNDILAQVYEIIKENGLQYEYLISNTAKIGIGFYRKKENVEKALKCYLQIKDEEIKNIIIKCIRLDATSRRHYAQIKGNFKIPQQRILDKIFEK